jgi:hypothetical protein
MIKYEANTLFPHPQYLHRGEISVAMLNEGFFDIALCLNNLTTKETETVRQGDMKLYLYETLDVPFIILDFGGGFSIDVSIDITKISGSEAQKWLTSEANTINIFLVEAASGILKGMRMISINFADDIRTILSRQICHTDVQSRISTAMRITTKEMIQRSSKYMKFAR